MPKVAKKITENKLLSSTEIYEMIQAKDFLQELWWDLLSDIKEKPTYKRLQSMVDDVVHNNLKSISTKLNDGTELSRRQAILTEISMMTCTVDTFISEVLYKKFENEYKLLVTKIIDEALNESQSSSEQESTSVFENIERIFHKDTNKENKLKSTTKAEDIPLNKQNAGATSAIYINKRGRPRKNIVEKMLVNENDETISPEKRKRGRPRLNAEHPDAIEKKKSKPSPNSNFKNNLNKVTEMKNKDTNLDVEVKSEGSFSVDSLSSVRTSELSNFEDAISACSDGETNGKLIIPLKIANDLYTRGKLSQIYHISRKGQNHKNLFNNKNLEDTSSSSSVNAMSASRPQRIRKPNSKYNSEFMYCDVKDYSSSNIDSGSSSSPEEKNAAATPLPLKRQRKHKKIFEQ